MIINHLDNLNNRDGTRIDFTYVANILLNLTTQSKRFKAVLANVNRLSNSNKRYL